MPSVLSPPEHAIAMAGMLSLTGGFLDAFTFVGHGRVFANAMTGNIVFLGIFAAAGQWASAARHVLPIGAYVLGIFTASLLRCQAPQRRPAIVLGVMIAVLLIVAALPRTIPDFWIVIAIAFGAAMLYATFSQVESGTYSPVVMTGNLRRLTEAGFAATVPPREAGAARQALALGAILAGFLIGCMLGAMLTRRFGNSALLLPCLGLIIGLYRLRRAAS